MIKNFYFFAFLVLCAIGLTGCEDPVPTADQVQSRQQESLSKQSNSTVGMPAIGNFAEKKMLKDIIELRDKTPPTFTYIPDMNGRLHKICDSIGYGFNGATQFTNPQRIIDGANSRGYAIATIAQADPNGLYSPATDEGTWIMCKDPHSAKIGPVRMEPRSIVSPFPLD